jgi:hypothetical protein
MSSPCHHHCDWTDADQTDLTDEGCCSPAPIRRNCNAPTLPVPECNEEDPVITFDDDSEEFTVITKLYDQNCSAITDQNGSIITTAIS